MKKYASVIAPLLALCLLARAAQAAFIFNETGDAGELPITAQSTGSSSDAVLSIFGTLASSDAFHDVDMFAITVTGLSFSATTVGTATTGTPQTSGVLDTQLFLFDQNGTLVASNDNDPNILDPNDPEFLHSTIMLTGLTPGLYFIAISEWPDAPADDPISAWKKDDGPLYGGSYEIALEGANAAQISAAVPEPSSCCAMSLLLSIAAGAFARHRKAACAAV